MQSKTLKDWIQADLATATLTGSEEIHTVQSNASVKTTAQAIANLVDLSGKENTGVASGLVSTHESTYTHANIAHTNRAALDLVSGTNTGDQDLSGYSLTSHNHTGVYQPAGTYSTDIHANIAALNAVSGTNTGDQFVFKTISVSGQSDVVADTTTDTLTLVGGTGISITTDATTDTLTITATGTATPGAHASSHVTGGSDVIANAVAGSAAGLMSAADKTKLDGVASGATVGADWNTNVTNKPTLGTAAALNIPAAGNASATEVVYGSDTRLSDARTPTTHAHAASDITGTAVLTNDSRLSDARTPTAHASSHINTGGDPVPMNNWHGVVSRTTVAPLPTSITTTTFTLTTGTTPLQYYYKGTLVTVNTNKSVTITATAGKYYIYFADATGTLSMNASFPDLKANVLVAVVVWNGTNLGLVYDERHNYTRNIDWHLAAHEGIGTRYISGLAFSYAGTTNANTTFGISSGQVSDEDISFAITAQTVGRIWYQTSATTYDFLAATSTLPYYWTTGIVAVNGSTYALVAPVTSSTRYFNYFIYASTDVLNPIYIVTETVAAGNVGGYTTAANARAVSPPSFIGMNMSAELKLLYRVVVNGAGLVQAPVSGDDYRTGGSIAGGGTASTSHASLSNLELAGTGVLYGHIDDQAQTIAGAKTFTNGVVADVTGTASGNPSTASLAALSTGLVKVTTGTGALTTAAASDVTGQLLTGYSSGAGTVAATDTILQAINKLNGNNAALVSDTAYGSGWNGVTTIAPSKNAVYDEIELRAPKASPTFTGNASFVETTDTVYTITDGAAFEIDPSNGNVQVITLGASRTPAATNFAAGQTMLLGIDDGTAYSITWTSVAPTWVKPGGTASAPTLATTGYTWILLWKVSTTIYAAEVGKP